MKAWSHTSRRERRKTSRFLRLAIRNATRRGGGCGQACPGASVLPKTVEVGRSWFNRFRRLQTHWEKRQDLHLGFVELTARLIIWRKLAPVAPIKKSSG